MTLAHHDDWLTVHVGDNRAILPTLPAASVHCVVTLSVDWRVHPALVAFQRAQLGVKRRHLSDRRIGHPGKRGATGVDAARGVSRANRLDGKDEFGLTPLEDQEWHACRKQRNGLGLGHMCPVPVGALWVGAWVPLPGDAQPTAMVAQSLSRRAVLIELNPDYVGQAMTRNADVPLGLEAA